MNIVDDLTARWKAEQERADYAWRNTRTIEAARQEEMRKRDAAEAENARLRTLLRQGLRHNGEVRGASRLAGEASSAEGATSTVVLERGGDE